jgi:hypothetical protein
MTSACGSACYTKSDIDQHVPITYKMLAVVVSAGSSFQPPPGWNSPITVAAPEFSKPGGIYPERFYLELSCPTPDAQIFYSSTTTNVTVGSNRYQRPLGIGSKRTVSARAFKSGYYSPVKTMTYEIQQTNFQYPTSNVQCPMGPTQPPQNIFSISGKPVKQGQQEPGIYLKRIKGKVERILVIQ